MLDNKDFVEIAVGGVALSVKLMIDEVPRAIAWLRTRKRSKPVCRLFVRTNSIGQLVVVQDERTGKERRQRNRRQMLWAQFVSHGDIQEKRIAQRRTFTRRAADRLAAA